MLFYLFFIRNLSKRVDVMVHPLDKARDAASSIHTSDITTEIVKIDTVEDREYHERVFAYVEIKHPELERLVAKYDVTRGCVPDQTDEVREHVEHHVNPNSYGLSSLVDEHTLSFTPNEYLGNPDDDLIDAVRTAINAYDYHEAVCTILSDAERAYWILSCTDGRDPRAIVDGM